MSIPTLIILKDGEQVDRTVGVIEKEDLEKMIEDVR
jgi:thioredoxin-like negative regulator of GroEL